MKQDFKKKKIQINYRKQLKDKGAKHYNKEIIITAIMLTMILLVFFLFDYKPFQNKDIQIREVEIKK
ncbi:hypothetical protein [Bacillus sp. 1NLA3E]|uniref:hypothetical protein n=1 Tax=Bacillus sp. 1NLA3E TaxID=666686 RepID=UPI000247ECBE|nr:hypothetical protein [Bacillus sp. 1NLA3E]